MDKNSKILLVITVILIVISIFFAYNRFFVDEDFIIFNSEEE